VALCAGFQPVRDLYVPNVHAPLSQSPSDSPVLYTVTRDATLRIFIPVLDSPQHMQLHATLDLSTTAPPKRKSDNPSSNVFYLDRETFRSVLTTVLKDASDTDNTKLRRLQEICDDEWDMFMQVLPDGTLTVRAVAASTLPVIIRYQSHLSIEYRSSTSNPSQTAHPSSKYRCFST